MVGYSAAACFRQRQLVEAAADCIRAASRSRRRIPDKCRCRRSPHGMLLSFRMAAVIPDSRSRHRKMCRRRASTPEVDTCRDLDRNSRKRPGIRTTFARSWDSLHYICTDPDYNSHTPTGRNRDQFHSIRRSGIPHRNRRCHNIRTPPHIRRDRSSMSCIPKSNRRDRSRTLRIPSGRCTDRCRTTSSCHTCRGRFRMSRKARHTNTGRCRIRSMPPGMSRDRFRSRGTQACTGTGHSHNSDKSGNSHRSPRYRNIRSQVLVQLDPARRAHPEWRTTTQGAISNQKQRDQMRATGVQ